MRFLLAKARDLHGLGRQRPGRRRRHRRGRLHRLALRLHGGRLPARAAVGRGQCPVGDGALRHPAGRGAAGVARCEHGVGEGNMVPAGWVVALWGLGTASFCGFFFLGAVRYFFESMLTHSRAFKTRAAQYRRFAYRPLSPHFSAANDNPSRRPNRQRSHGHTAAQTHHPQSQHRGIVTSSHSHPRDVTRHVTQHSCNVTATLDRAASG